MPSADNQKDLLSQLSVAALDLALANRDPGTKRDAINKKRFGVTNLLSLEAVRQQLADVHSNPLIVEGIVRNLAADPILRQKVARNATDTDLREAGAILEKRFPDFILRKTFNEVVYQVTKSYSLPLDDYPIPPSVNRLQTNRKFPNGVPVRGEEVLLALADVATVNGRVANQLFLELSTVDQKRMAKVIRDFPPVRERFRSSKALGLLRSLDTADKAPFYDPKQSFRIVSEALVVMSSSAPGRIVNGATRVSVWNAEKGEFILARSYEQFQEAVVDVVTNSTASLIKAFQTAGPVKGSIIAERLEVFMKRNSELFTEASEQPAFVELVASIRTARLGTSPAPEL